MTTMQIKVEKKSCGYRGYLQIDEYTVSHQLFAGGMSGPLAREVVERGNVGAVLPYDPYRDEVVLIDQFRIGAHAAGFTNPWLTECVAGVIEQNESPEQLATREAFEEAGCELLRLEPISTFFTSPGAMSEMVWLFCGQVDTSGVGGIHGLDHEGEDIRVAAYPRSEAQQMLQSGVICNAITIVALQWLALEHNRLRNLWCSSTDSIVR